MAGPGWYPAPDGSDRMRYWDGNAWLDYDDSSTTRQTDLIPAAPANESSFKLPKRASQPAPMQEFDHVGAPEGTQWLRKWKGWRHKTSKQLLSACCQSCGRDYQLTGEIANELARQLGTFHKVGRGADFLWMVSTIGGSVSDKAGKQLQTARAESDFQESFTARNEAIAAALCPACGSHQVLIESPKD